MNNEKELKLLSETAFAICFFTALAIAIILMSYWHDLYGDIIYYVLVILLSFAYAVWVFYCIFIPYSKEKKELIKKIDKLKDKYKDIDLREIKEDELRAEYKLNKIRNKIKEYRSI